MFNERLLNENLELFKKEIRNVPLFNIADLAKAALAGCNSVTGKQHPKAQEIVDEYVATKKSDVFYTEGDMKKAFTISARVMANQVDKENEKVRLSTLVKKEQLQKAAKLVCACEQLMTIADGFNKEAEKLLSKQGVFKTEIKAEWNKAAKIFRVLQARMKKTYMGFSIDEACDWSEETEALENAIREIMAIDIFEETRV